MCNFEFLRIENYLRQTHGLSQKEKYDAARREATLMTLHSSSESSAEKQRMRRKQVMHIVHWELLYLVKTYSFDSDSDGDINWVAKRYVDKIACSSDEDEVGADEDEVGADEDEDDDDDSAAEDDEDDHDAIDHGDGDDDVDYEDQVDIPILSPYEEEREMAAFMKWLKSINGVNKSERKAIKHKSTLMLILRYDDSIPINLDNLRSMSFLSN